MQAPQTVAEEDAMNPRMHENLPTVVIGAGPVGLAAAAHLLSRGMAPLVLEAGDDVAANVRDWGHVRLFSPWRYDVDKESAKLLEADGWSAPNPDELPTGADLVARYLRPLANLFAARGQIRFGHRVLAVTRLGTDKVRTKGRATTPFVVRVRDRSGSEDDRLDRAHLAFRDDVRRFIARRVEPGALDDLVQEVFLKVHESSGELRDADRLGSWLFRIARNVVIDHLRKRATRMAKPLDEVDEPATLEPEVNFNQEMAAWFRPMMDLLPEEYRVALELTEIEGLTQRELADRTGLSLSGAKSRVQRAKQLLEGVVRACCDFEVDVHGNFVSCRPRSGGSCKSC